MPSLTRAEEAARSVEGATSDVAGIGMWLYKRAKSSKDKQSKARHVKSRHGDLTLRKFVLYTYNVCHDVSSSRNRIAAEEKR